MSSDDSQTGASFPEIDTRRSFLASLLGMKIADRYEVIRVLGEGGMGVVVEARHTELDQRVAIKFMFPEFLSNDVLSARFAREAKIAAKIQSPHIVRVSDVGRLANGVPYLVMDLLDGKDLGAELDAKGPMPVERAVDYVLQAAAGIAALHALGVVHRDLKPSNLFVADISGVPTVKVLDFGISKEVTAPSAALTSTETQLGTPMYMSPEQIRASKNVDTRSDVWSLGVILYELLTGVLPFERSGHSIGELFAVILMTEPVPLCMRRPELPVALEEVVMRCLRRNSWERFDSVAALADALRPFTRSTSLHRIDTVRRALGIVPPSVDPTGDPPRSEQLTVGSPGAVASKAPAPPKAPTLDLELSPVPARSSRREPAVFASLVSSSRAVSNASAPSSRSGLVVAIGISAAVIGAAAIFALRAGAPSTPPEAPPVAATEAPPVPTAAPAAREEGPSPRDLEALRPSAPVAPRPTPVTVKAASVGARPAAPPRATSAASSLPVPSTRPSTPPPTTSKTDDLILDRK